MDGSVRNVRLARTVGYLVMRTGIYYVMSVMVHIMPIVFVHKWQVFRKMVGSVKDAEGVRTVTVKPQDQDRVAGGMLTTLCVILATNKEIKDLPVHAVEEPTDIQLKGR